MTIPKGLMSGFQILWRVVLFFVIVGAVFVVPVASKIADWEADYPLRTLLYMGVGGRMLPLFEFDLVAGPPSSESA